jgi:YlqD protein
MTTNQQLQLKRPVSLKVIVTPRWKEEVQQQLQGQLSQLDAEIAQLESQGQRAISEIQKQSLTPIPPQAAGQIENIQQQVYQKKNEFLAQKNQLLQQIQQVQLLEFDQEVIQAQMESYCTVAVGDNLIEKLNVEVVIKDGFVQEIRGTI